MTRVACLLSLNISVNTLLQRDHNENREIKRTERSVAAVETPTLLPISARECRRSVHKLTVHLVGGTTTAALLVCELMAVYWQKQK